MMMLGGPCGARCRTAAASRMLRELLDNPVEPLVHPAQLGAQAIERGGVAHLGCCEILVARIIARELDARFRELVGDELCFRERGGCGPWGGVRPWGGPRPPPSPRHSETGCCGAPAPW